MTARFGQWTVLLGTLAALGCSSSEGSSSNDPGTTGEDAATTSGEDTGGTGTDITDGDVSSLEDVDEPSDTDGGGTTGEDTDEGDATGGGTTGPDVEEDTWVDPAELWGDEVTLVTVDGAGKAALTGELEDGSTEVSGGEDAGCWGLGEDKQFAGSNEWFALAEPLAPGQRLELDFDTTTDGKSLGIYAMVLPADSYNTPNDFEGAIWCSGAYDPTYEGEAVSLAWDNLSKTESYNVFFAVAAGNWTGSVKSGEWTMDVSVTDIENLCYSQQDNDLGAWPPHVKTVSVDPSDGTAQVEGDLSEGAPVCGLDWAWVSGIACFPGTQQVFYEGNHVYYALEEELPPHSIISVTVTPDPGVEVSLYGYEIGTTNFIVPPLNVTSVVSCEASNALNLQHNPNPGVAETLSWNAINNGYNLFFAVAGYGPNGTSGRYTIDIKVITDGGDTCTEDDFPAGSPTEWHPDVELVSLTADSELISSAQFDGDLATGETPCTLDWADDSPVACWPGTQDVYFQGPHVQYALAEPVAPYSTVNVTVTPKTSDVDVNLYGWWMGTGNFYSPPYVPSVGACEAAYNASLTKDPDPGVPVTISFMNPTANEYNYFFAVAGHGDMPATGEYTVSVEQVSAPGSACPESLPGANYSSWPQTVEAIELTGGAATVNGNLADGSCVDLAWASSSQTACFPATKFEHFEGNHVMYRLAEPMPANSTVTIKVTPDSGVDANLYGYQVGASSFYVPPAVPTAISCEASHGAGIGFVPNPGQVEEITFTNPTNNDYQVFFAVAGNTDTGTAGGYTIEIEQQVSQPFCEESLPGQDISSWPAQVTTIALDEGGAGSANGNLSTGSCVHLDFASSSQIACFPATENEGYQGNQVFYALENPLPPNSEVTIAVTPAPGVDVSLYGLQTGASNYELPPKVDSAVACEASYAKGVGFVQNPGETEWITFSNPSDTNSYNIFFAVAGTAVDGTSGAFSVDVNLVTSEPYCEESLPGEPYSGWPGNVTVLELENGDYSGASGMAGPGADCVNLDWASDSDTACFPATEFNEFEGKQVYFALSEPLAPGSIVNITVTPKSAMHDLNLYGYQLGSQNYFVPPYVPSAVSCEAAWPKGVGDTTNPGQAETIQFQNPTASSWYNIFFAVTKPAGGLGGFDIEINTLP